MFRTLSPGDSISEKTAPKKQKGESSYIHVCKKGSRQTEIKITHQVKEFSILCMGMQVSGLTEVIAFICTSACYFCSVPQSRPILCDPIDCRRPGFSVLHYIPEFTQTDVHQVNDAIQSSYPLFPLLLLLQSFPASGSFPMSQLFKSAGQNIGASASASVLPMNIQG